jgi:asparagine synthase (glutamine-hydrolysing)
MCGIVGVLDHVGAPVDRQALERACASIAHRGPDDEGIHIDGPVGLGHRRLSIIDVSTDGHQPMCNEDETVWLTYNGEIYNFRDLRRLLEACGHRFRSHTDSEVLIHGWEEWGESLVDRLNGIFAFAIWDSRTHELFLARDRLGVKPLYLCSSGGALLFASEVKAILAYRGAPAQLSLPALMEYMTFQNVLGERTLFDGVSMLPAGTVIRVAQDGSHRPRTYFDPVPQFDVEPGDTAAVVDELRHVLQLAINRQLVADVPLGAYLSGGMDSASLVTLAARRIPHIHTFTAGFDMSDASPLELAADERGDAEVVARQVGTEHYEAVLHAGDMERVLPSLVWHLEDLRAGTCYQNFYAARLASRFVTVVLAGTGGDELFAGYPWRYERLSQMTEERNFSDVYYDYWCRLVPDAQKPDLFTADAFAEASSVNPRECFDDVTAHVRGLEPIDRALYFEQRTFLHGLLVVEDKLSMAHSMEARVPLLDNALVDFSLRLPGRLKNSSPHGKQLLRDAARTFLSGELVAKRKQGFSPPDRGWYQGRNLRYVREILLDASTLSRGVFKPAFIEQAISQHASGQADHRLLIWSLLCLEWWHRLFVDVAPAVAPVAPVAGMTV